MASTLEQAPLLEGTSQRMTLGVPIDHARPRRRLSAKLRKEIATLTSQLAIMTRSGLDIASALLSLQRQSRQPALRSVLADVHADLTAGKSLSAALSPHVDLFGVSYIATVSSGEASGRMSEVLSQLADLLRNENRLRARLRTMLAYPVMLTSVAMLVVLGLILFVLPRFAEIFADYDVPLPILTQFLLSFAGEITGRFWLWGTLAGGLLVAGVAVFRSPAGKHFLHRGLLSWLVIRDVTRSILIGRVCRLLGLMVRSGVPLLESLQITRTSVTNKLYQDLLDDMEESIIAGQGIAEPLMAADFVPGSAAEMIITAEATGSLGSVMQMLGEHYEQEGEEKMRETVTIMEPVITVVMGVVVATVVLAVMLPMFDLATFTN